MHTTTAFLASVLLLIQPVSSFAQVTPSGGSEARDAIVLVTTYADGRTVRHVVTRKKSRSWTPLFPRVPSWTPPPGALSVFAINYRKQLLDDEVTVAVSVLRGDPYEREDAVATVTLKRGDRRVVEQLRDFGAEPVTLTLTALDATLLHVPTVLNQTAGLDVSEIEVLTDPSPKYRVHVKNLSTKGALTFHYRTHRGDRLSLSGQQGNRDGQVLIPPGATHVFDVPGSSGASPTVDGWAPASVDYFEIASVLWDDSTFEGDTEPVASALMLAMGRQVQLSRVIRLFRAAMTAQQPPAAIRAMLAGQLESLSVVLDDEIRAAGYERLRHVVEDPQRRFAAAPPGMREVKNGALADLQEAPSTASEFARWLQDITSQYEVWRERFARR